MTSFPFIVICIAVSYVLFASIFAKKWGSNFLSFSGALIGLSIIAYLAVLGVREAKEEYIRNVFLEYDHLIILTWAIVVIIILATAKYPKKHEE